MGALAAGEIASRSRLRRLTRPLAAPHLARESGPLQQAAVLRSSHTLSRSELAATTPSEQNR